MYLHYIIYMYIYICTWTDISWDSMMGVTQQSAWILELGRPNSPNSSIFLNEIIFHILELCPSLWPFLTLNLSSIPSTSVLVCSFHSGLATVQFTQLSLEFMILTYCCFFYTFSTCLHLLKLVLCGHEHHIFLRVVTCISTMNNVWGLLHTRIKSTISTIVDEKSSDMDSSL